MEPITFPPELLSYLRAARHVAVLTGAGVSAESGVPTFRDAQTGLWARYRPEDLATPDAFRKNPELVLEWYAWRRELVTQTVPNPGHHALAELERRLPRLTLITQNVDGLHQRAGSGQRFPVIELHGNLQRFCCLEARHPVESWPETGERLPACPVCGSPLRPDVVWFGEMLPPQALEAAWQAARTCDLFFSIGTSGLVEPAASLPFMALRAGAVVVEINLGPTPLTSAASYAFAAPSGEVLPALISAAWPGEK